MIFIIVSGSFVQPFGLPLTPVVVVLRELTNYQQQQNIAETLRRQGGVIEGYREGRPTKLYLQKVMMRITFVGAIYLGLIAILAWIVSLVLAPFGITVDTTSEAGFIIGSVGLLIVVGVVLDTMKQLEAQLTMRHYERFIGG